MGEILGFDKTYISMIETGRRAISDMATRRHIAKTLGIPSHFLGVTENDDADFVAMIQFADSTIRLAEIARKNGRAVDAVNELWPLVARLEARAAEGRIERDTMLLLSQARLSLGVSLGTVLPEERLATAASWTSRAVLIAQRLDSERFLAHALRMHGNELRKANRTGAAVARLERAAQLSTDREGEGTALALLARAAGEHGDSALFDTSMRACYELLETGKYNTGMIFNPFSLREINIRGLMSTGRIRTAMRLLASNQPKPINSAPQWQIIEQVTTGEVLLAAGEQQGAREALSLALADAETFRLPHQVQRMIRAAERGGLADLATAGNDALARLRACLARPFRQAR